MLVSLVYDRIPVMLYSLCLKSPSRFSMDTMANILVITFAMQVMLVFKCQSMKVFANFRQMLADIIINI